MLAKIAMPTLIGFFLAFSLSGCAVTAEQLQKKSEGELFFYTRQQADGLLLFRDYQLYRQEIVRRHPEWPDAVKEAVSNGKILIGMTSYQVAASWGITDNKHQTMTPSGTTEMWVYGSGGNRTVYLFFNGDILTSIQDSQMG